MLLDVPEYYTEEVLSAIEDNFGENLRRGFHNQDERLQNTEEKKPVEFENASFSSGYVYMSIKNLFLMELPEFRVKKLDADLKTSTLDAKFTLGEIQFEADFQVVNKTMFQKMPMVTNNRVKITLNNAEASGLIGFMPVEDSFVPKNYAMDYTFISADIEEIHEVNPLCHKPEKTTFNHYELSPINLFMSELEFKLNDILHKQLSPVMIEYSVNELLLDKVEEVTAFKLYLNNRKQRANRMADALIDRANMTGLFTKADLRQEFMLSYKRDASCRRNILLAKGKMLDCSVITRPEEWNLYENEKSLIYFGYLSLKDFKFEYNYTTKDNNNETDFKGVIKVTVYKNKLMVKIIKPKHEEAVSFKLNLEELRDLEIDVSGLGSLSWLLPDVKALALGHIRMETRSVIVEYLTRKLSDTYLRMCNEKNNYEIY